MEPNMQRTVDLAEFRRKLPLFLDEVVQQHTSLVLTRG